MAVTVDETVLIQFKTDQRKLKSELNKVKTETKNTTESVTNSFKSMGVVIGAVITSQAIGKVIEYSDTWKSVESQLKLVTSSSAQLASVQKEVFKTAQDTRSSYESTATLYARMARSSEELGLSQAQLLSITKSINQTMSISGATTAEASGAITQLSQAFAAGALRGDEFNSVNEASPRIMEAIAKSLGVTRGKLRELAEEGKITAKVMSDAFLGQAQTIESEYGQIDTTVGQAFTNLENSALLLVGTIDDITGATGFLAEAMQTASSAIDTAALSMKDFDFYIDSTNLGVKFYNYLFDEQNKLIKKNVAVKEDLVAVEKKTKAFNDELLKFLEDKVRMEEEDAIALEKKAFFTEQQKDKEEQAAAAAAWYTEKTEEQTVAAKKVTEAIKEKVKALEQEATTTKEIDNGGIGKTQVDTYTVFTPFNETLKAMAETWIDNSTAIDNSTTIVNNFSSNMSTATSVLGSVISDLASISRVMGADIVGRARTALYGGTNKALSYREARGSAISAMASFINNPTSTDSAKAYQTAINALIGTLDEFNDSTKYATSQQQEYEKAKAIRDIKQFEELQLEQKEVVDENIQLLKDIKDGISGTGGMTEATNNVKTALGTVNTSVNNQDYYEEGVKSAVNSQIYYEKGVKEAVNSQTGNIQNVQDAVNNQTYYDKTVADKTDDVAAAVGLVHTDTNYMTDKNTANLKNIKIKVIKTTSGVDANNISWERTEYVYYKRGGYTGNYGVNQVAGLVHGQEYVVNAQTTKDLGLNGEGGTFAAMLAHLYEINKTTKKNLSVDRQLLETTKEIA